MIKTWMICDEVSWISHKPDNYHGHDNGDMRVSTMGCNEGFHRHGATPLSLDGLFHGTSKIKWMRTGALF